MKIHSLLRNAEHAALSRITLSGPVLDLGGSRKSEYQSLFRGSYSITTLNLDPAAEPDIIHDLEQMLPIVDAAYDGVLLINTLEHVFNYRELIAESVRVLKPEGILVIIVPFLFPVHPSPQDFRRFTASALIRECELVRLKDIHVEALGGGVFSATYVMVDRLLPNPLRALNYYSGRHVALFLDYLCANLSRALGKKYNRADYALGYCLTAKKTLV